MIKLCVVLAARAQSGFAISLEVGEPLRLNNTCASSSLSSGTCSPLEPLFLAAGSVVQSRAP